MKSGASDCSHGVSSGRPIPQENVGGAKPRGDDQAFEVEAMKSVHTIAKAFENTYSSRLLIVLRSRISRAHFR
jgi:hypothetical protein